MAHSATGFSVSASESTIYYPDGRLDIGGKFELAFQGVNPNLLAQQGLASSDQQSSFIMKFLDVFLLFFMEIMLNICSIES